MDKDDVGLGLRRQSSAPPRSARVAASKHSHAGTCLVPRFISPTPARRQHCQQNALEAKLASVAVEPLLQSVRAAAGAAAADGDGLAAERQRNVRVGRSALHLRRVAQLRIHGANYLQDAGVRIQLARRTVSDHDHFATEPDGRRREAVRASVARVSSSTAWSSACRRARSRRSISAMEVERISTRMLADSGIEFTEVPPRITPTLKVVFGEAGTGVCAEDLEWRAPAPRWDWARRNRSRNVRPDRARSLQNGGCPGPRPRSCRRRRHRAPGCSAM